MTDRDWIQKLVGEPAFEQLASGLAGSELQPVLLEVMRRRAAGRHTNALLTQYRDDAFCVKGLVDQRTSVAVDSVLLEAATHFEAIELSPVAPLGTCSVVALTDQHRVLSTLRAMEVVSDPTNLLAFESALRLRVKPNAAVHLATSMRVVRAQPVPARSGHSQHFRIFVLTSAGRESKDHGFTVEALLLQIRTMLAALDGLERRGYSFGVRRVDVLATAKRAHVGDRIAETLGGVATRAPLEHAYYSAGLRYQIWVTAPDGDAIPLVDGGAFDWLTRIASNKRLAYVATGAGAQLIPLKFKVA